MFLAFPHKTLRLISLLPISEFMLDKKFQRNASKFAICYKYKNPKLLFPFFIWCNFMFLPNECPDRPGHSLGKNIKLHEMKNGKSNFGFLYLQNMAYFEPFRWKFLSSINSEIGRSDILAYIQLIWLEFF